MKESGELNVESKISGPARHRTQVERRELAETSLLEAAVMLLVEKGFDRFTLAEVGRKAGYSRGIAAHYFGSKTDLLARVAKQVTETYSKTRMSEAQHKPGLDTLIWEVQRYASALDRPAIKALNIILAEAIVNPDLAVAVLKLNQSGLKWLENQFDNGIAAGNIRSDINVKVEAKVVYAFMRGLQQFASVDAGFEPLSVAIQFGEYLRKTLSA